MRSVPYGKRILTVLLLGLLCLIYIAARIAQVSEKNLQTSSNFVCNYGLLPKLAALHGCTKLNTHDNYFDAYENIFCNLRNRNNRIRLIEFGIGGYANSNKGGGSLKMWASYFGPYSKIIGVDIEPKNIVFPDNVQIYQGSQADINLLKNTLCSEEIDIVIDDGSHRPKDIIITFETLWPCLRKNGIYVVEDTQTSYIERFGGSKNLNAEHATFSYFKNLIDQQNYQEILNVDKDFVPHHFAPELLAIYFYHNLIIIMKGDNSYPSNLPRQYT